ncbi:MAG: winged helix-turn-helix domain-containing protein [Nanoarchaeota archaeon]
MKQVIICPAGEKLDNVMAALKLYKPEKVYILSPKKYKEQSNVFKPKLEDKGIAVKIIDVGESLWLDFLETVSGLVCIHAENQSDEDSKEFIMHTDTGDAELRSIATVAAFVNGIKAISYDDCKIRLLPLFNLRYQTVITDKKMQILKILEEDVNCCKSFEELSKRTGMSLPLVSYHINGNLKSEGLKKLGLIETRENNGRINVTLSTQGLLLLKGYIRPVEEDITKKTQEPCNL